MGRRRSARGAPGVFASGTSAASPKSAPVNTTAPSISGTPILGATLTGNAGGWTSWGTRYSYSWLRCDNGGGNCAPISGATGTTETLGSADVGSTLRFSVVAASRRGSTSATSDATSVVSQPASGSTPSAPTGLTATGPTTNSVSLTWSASPDGTDPAAGYNVYVNDTLVSSTSGTSATVKSLDCGKSYTFAVEAYDGVGTKSAQDSTSASTSDCPLSPSAPTGLTASGPTTNSIALTWTASSGGTDPTAGYNVYVNQSLVSSTAGTSASVGSLDCGKSYTFAVEAYDALGNKSAQDSTSASTSACPSSNSPIYWGAWIEGTDTYSSLYGGSWGNAPWDSNTWTKYQQNTGKAPSIVHWGVGTPWGHSFSYWAGTLNLVQNRGALNLLDIDTGSASLSSIASGSEDSAIKTWAQQAAAYGHPFFLRLDWEMNGGWFPWGTTSSNQNTPADYVAAWRHIHDIFSAAGAANVTWVWCPNLEGNSSTPYSKLYPGDAYVDWTCLDGLQPGFELDELLQPLHEELHRPDGARSDEAGHDRRDRLLRVRRRRKGGLDLGHAERAPHELPADQGARLVQLADPGERHVEELGDRIVRQLAERLLEGDRGAVLRRSVELQHAGF